MKKLKTYISGPMTGIKDYNFKAFERMEKELSAIGEIPINPHKIHGSDRKDLPYEFYLKNDIQALLQCDQIIMLPGWTKSKGANLEYKIARAINIKTISIK